MSGDPPLSKEDSRQQRKVGVVLGGVQSVRREILAGLLASGGGCTGAESAC